MNVLSLNIRGMGCSSKIEWLKRLKMELKFSFWGIQESRLSSLPCGICNWWGFENVGVDFVESNGRSGGAYLFMRQILIS